MITKILETLVVVTIFFRLSLHASSMLEMYSEPSLFLLWKAQNLLWVSAETPGAEIVEKVRKT